MASARPFPSGGGGGLRFRSGVAPRVTVFVVMPRVTFGGCGRRLGVVASLELVVFA
eukprot:COSAG01_NODE_39145_length_480_cov_1.333333_1_plen_55_part_01